MADENIFAFCLAKAEKEKKQRGKGKSIVELYNINGRNVSQETFKKEEELVYKDGVEDKRRKKQEEKTEKLREKKERKIKIF